MVSRRAAKSGIPSETALVLLAKEEGIGTSHYERKLDSNTRAIINRNLLNAPVARAIPSKPVKNENRKKPSMKDKSTLTAAIKFLVSDQELLSRCQDLLTASSKHDRAVNQATQVLEERIRKTATLTARLVGENLVNFAFKEEISKSVLQVTSKDIDDQRGFTQILRGVFAAFRNKTHHHIIDLSQEDALRVVGFIDVLLRVIASSTKNNPSHS